MKQWMLLGCNFRFDVIGDVEWDYEKNIRFVGYDIWKQGIGFKKGWRRYARFRGGHDPNGRRCFQFIIITTKNVRLEELSPEIQSKLEFLSQSWDVEKIEKVIP